MVKGNPIINGLKDVKQENNSSYFHQRILTEKEKEKDHQATILVSLYSFNFMYYEYQMS